MPRADGALRHAANRCRPAPCCEPMSPCAVLRTRWRPAPCREPTAPGALPRTDVTPAPCCEPTAPCTMPRTDGALRHPANRWRCGMPRTDDALRHAANRRRPAPCCEPMAPCAVLRTDGALRHAANRRRAAACREPLARCGMPDGALCRQSSGVPARTPRAADRSHPAPHGAPPGRDRRRGADAALAMKRRASLGCRARAASSPDCEGRAPLRELPWAWPAAAPWASASEDPTGGADQGALAPEERAAEPAPSSFPNAGMDERRERRRARLRGDFGDLRAARGRGRPDAVDRPIDRERSLPARHCGDVACATGALII